MGFFSVIIYMSIRIGEYCLLVIIVLEFPIEISDVSECSDAVTMMMMMVVQWMEMMMMKEMMSTQLTH